MKGLWSACLILWGAGQEPAQPGIAVRELGVGFPARTKVPNIVPRRDAEQAPQYVGRTHTWMPFQVTLDNLGPPVEGTLFLRRPFAAGPENVVHSMRFVLPSRTVRRFSFPVLHAGVHETELSLEDASGRTVVLQGASKLQVPPPHSIVPDAPLVLVATESAGNFSHFLERALGGQFGRDRYVVPIEPTRLPARAIEYHGVDVVVLDDIPPEALSFDQQDALCQFAARGGTLAVALNPQTPRGSATKLDRILPGTPFRVENLTEVAALAAVARVPCRLDKPTAMTVFSPSPGARTWHDALPVILHRPYESGRVVLMGFSLSAGFLESWPGTPRLMEALADSAKPATIPLAGALQVLDLRKEIALALKRSMIRSLPPFGAIVGFMLGYALVIVVLPYALSRPFKRLEWAWAGVATLAFAGALTVYAVGARYLRGDTIAFRVGLVEGGREGGPRLRHNFWALFTARGTPLDLSFEEASTAAFPLGKELGLRGAGDAEPMTLAFDSFRVRGLRTYTQDSSLFETTDVQAMPGSIRVAAERRGDALDVTLRIDAGFPLGRAWLIEKDRVRELESSAAEERAFPSSGIPMEHAVARLARGEDLLVENAVAVMLRQASTWSGRHGGAVFLYTYEGARSLRSPALPERGVDFGWLEVEDPAEDAAETRWEPRREGMAEGYYGIPSSPEGEIKYTLAIRGVREGQRVADLRCERGPSGPLTASYYNYETRSWVALRPGVHAPGPFVRYSPLGGAYARLRLRVPDPGYGWNFDADTAARNAAPLSRIERRKVP